MVYEIEEKNSDKNVIMIYTDGLNRNHGNVSGGKVLPTDKSAYGYYMTYQGAEKEKVFTAYGLTNNYCELKAFIESLKALRRYDIPVKLYSDSAYVVNTINNKWYEKWRHDNWDKKGGLLNKELWIEAIDLFEKFNFISVIKVKGHANNKYNNHVDEILNIAADGMEDL